MEKEAVEKEPNLSGTRFLNTLTPIIAYIERRIQNMKKALKRTVEQPEAQDAQR